MLSRQLRLPAIVMATVFLARSVIGGVVTSNVQTVSAAGGIGFVTTIGTAVRSSSGNASLPIVPGSTVAAGDTVVVAVTVGSFAGPVGCSDTKGNVYSVPADIRTTARLFICSSRIVVALTPSDRISATYPAFSGITTASASEYSGVSSAGASQATSGSSVSPSATTTLAVDGLVFGAVTYTSTPTLAARCPGTIMGPVSMGTGSGKRSLYTLYRQAPPGSASICGTLSASRPWLAAAVAYVPAAPPPSTDPQWAIDSRAAFTGITYGTTFTVPTGPGYTDGTNASVNLHNFIESKPDGASATNHTRIVFPAGFTYTFSGDGSSESLGGLVIKNRNNLTFDGTGSSIALNTGSVSTFSSAFFTQNSTHITFRGFAVDGGNTATGTTGAMARRSTSASMRP